MRGEARDQLAQLWRSAGHKPGQALAVHVRPAPPVDQLVANIEQQLGPDGELWLSARTGSFTDNEWIIDLRAPTWPTPRHAEGLSLSLALTNALDMLTG